MYRLALIFRLRLHVTPSLAFLSPCLSKPLYQLFKHNTKHTKAHKCFTGLLWCLVLYFKVKSIVSKWDCFGFCSLGEASPIQGRDSLQPPSPTSYKPPVHCTLCDVRPVAIFCFVTFLKFQLPIERHNSCRTNPTACGTCQKCYTKHHDWVDAPHCTVHGTLNNMNIFIFMQYCMYINKRTQRIIPANYRFGFSGGHMVQELRQPAGALHPAKECQGQVHIASARNSISTVDRGRKLLT